MVEEVDEIYVAWWNDWKTLGILPFPGGLLEQPAFVVEAIQAAEATWTETKGRLEEAREADMQRDLGRMERERRGGR